MKFETTIRRTELTVERTDTLRISRTRRLIYKRSSRFEPGAGDEIEILDVAGEEIVSGKSTEEPERS